MEQQYVVRFIDGSFLIVTDESFAAAAQQGMLVRTQLGFGINEVKEVTVFTGSIG